MTGNLLLDSAISIGAIALMVLAVQLAFKSPATRLEESSAQARLAFDEPDFAPVDWLFDEKGCAVLAHGQGGDFVLIYKHGADLVTRRIDVGAADVAVQDASLTITQTDPGSRAVTLRNKDAALWARKMSAA